mmetsp:Transcript_5978/g.11299  ORF Transcript_5978/g.11299 Transcript_5978/m.11299 type:complete len:441 (+) Transcript_5978:190-1512(+)|eukprot:CAMPEP_0176505838 /NCGR_PEP_ID=MMETSP0200_2-20121128/16717_1 /TAXON_ID=947934 /ORGANISM="Chaetoceros sp., Strain GSL56" /LENGTH=440 /DNA_ID=CAMNT_0017905437 /DNA_START=180 /DNA_END=1502 /DNA_ORIENTATION=-
MSINVQQTFDLFLSHNIGEDTLGRDNHVRVKKLQKALENANVHIFTFDSEQDQTESRMEEDTTDGIDRCHQVAIFLTKRYIDKVATKYGLEDTCRLEFDYSARRKGIKNLIPIVMEPECKELKNWKGVLGATLANVPYVDFSQDDMLHSCVRQILKRMHRKSLNDEVQFEDGLFRGSVNDQREPHGFGTMEYYNGFLYDGEWRNGKREGKVCILKYPSNGDTLQYEGSFKGDKFNGHGVITMRNGNRFEGTFSDGKLEGNGKHTLKNGTVEYIGKYKNGKPHGVGVKTFGNRSVYSGSFYDGKRHGEGKMSFPEVCEYNGQWADDKMEGSGTLVYNNGDKYTGMFQNNQMHGQGIYEYSDGAVYDGNYSYGTKCGQGTYTFKDKMQFYSGEWLNNKMNGQGDRVYSDGSVYKGSFCDNKRHGVGEMYFKTSSMKYVGGKM